MFEFDEEQRLTRKNIHDFAKKELAPEGAYWDASEANATLKIKIGRRLFGKEFSPPISS